MLVAKWRYGSAVLTQDVPEHLKLQHAADVLSEYGTTPDYFDTPQDAPHSMQYVPA